jgi:group I intron endonuclease
MATNKYARGKIYKLVNNVDEEIYIGSTIENLANRKCKHACDAKRRIQQKIYQHLNKIGWSNVKIILIENYACHSINELRARERYWIDELKPSLNKQTPLKTNNESSRTYYHNNKNTIAEKRATKVKCECGCEVSRSNLALHKTTKKHNSLISSQ